MPHPTFFCFEKQFPFLKSVLMILDLLTIFIICMLTSNYISSNFKYKHVFKRFLSSINDSSFSVLSRLNSGILNVFLFSRILWITSAKNYKADISVRDNAKITKITARSRSQMSAINNILLYIYLFLGAELSTI